MITVLPEAANGALTYAALFKRAPDSSMISGGRSQISPCPNGSSISRAPRAGGVKPVDTVSGRLRGIFAEMDGERQAYKVREAAHLSPGRFSKNRGFRVAILEKTAPSAPVQEALMRCELVVQNFERRRQDPHRFC